MSPLSQRRQIAGGVALFAAIGIGFGLLTGFFGDRVHLFDTAAHFRAHAAILLFLVAIVLVWSRLYAAALASAVAALLGLATVLPYMLPPPTMAAAAGAPRYTLLQMNLRFDAPDKPAALRLIGKLSPDVITVQEVFDGWRPVLDAIAGRYPYQFYCNHSDGSSDVAILSRRPFAEGDVGVCDPTSGFTAKRVDFNGLQVIVGSQHLRWPSPGRQWIQVARLAPTLAKLGDPLVIAGDFNAAPWSASVRTMAANSGTRIVAGIGPTWFVNFLPPVFARFVGLPIDNILTSAGIEILKIERPEATTSDHLPVLLTFTLPFANPEEPKVQTVSR
ncbi:MAG: AP endonuclease [Hyphomicrobiales bacterium]|nr:MAG: AP endonuclease [Hyphomicrobiales bacterium]